MVACALAALCGWIAFAVFSQTAQGHHAADQAQTLLAQNEALQQHIADDQAEIDQAQTTAWLEQAARKLGYIVPSEHLYIVTSPNPSPTSTSGGINYPLPVFSAPTPKPTPKPTPVPTPVGSPTPVPTPTPYVFVLPTSTASPH